MVMAIIMVRMLATMINDCLKTGHDCQNCHDCLKTGGVTDAGHDNHTIGREQSRLKGSHRQKLATYIRTIHSQTFKLFSGFVLGCKYLHPSTTSRTTSFFLRKFASLLRCLPRHSLALVKIKR